MFMYLLSNRVVDTTLRAALIELAKDSDRDVQFSASSALEGLAHHRYT